MRLKLLCGLVSLVAMATAATAALAARPGVGSCSGTPTAPGLVGSGTYSGFTVTGTCFFVPGAVITINGNLTVAAGASLNAHDGTNALVHVTGNVIVDKGGIVGLGQYGAPDIAQTGTVVDGNVIADQPQTLYLSAITVRGNIVSHGGSGPADNFPLKNLVVGGNVVLQGWSGLWIGLFRSQVGGNVDFSKNAGTQTGMINGVPTGVPDSSEIASNAISGNLICHGNSPAAQIGDSFSDGNTPNVVSGKALGQCVGLTTQS